MIFRYCRNNVVECLRGGCGLLRQCDVERPLNAHDQLDAFQTAQAKVAIEVCRPPQRRRVVAAQFLQQAARNLQDFGGNAGAAELSKGSGHVLGSGSRA
jgi:hypothetical protein